MGHQTGSKFHSQIRLKMTSQRRFVSGVNTPSVVPGDETVPPSRTRHVRSQEVWSKEVVYRISGPKLSVNLKVKKNVKLTE